MAKKAKPKGWKTFDQLARRLVHVSKQDVDKAEAKRKKRKRDK